MEAILLSLNLAKRSSMEDAVRKACSANEVYTAVKICPAANGSVVSKLIAQISTCHHKKQSHLQLDIGAPFFS